MSNLRKLTTTTALALILPLAVTTASLAQGGRGGGGGGGGHMGGGAGGGHMGGGMGGGHMGGGGMGGGHFGGGMGGGPGFSAPRGAGGASFAARGAPVGGANFAASRGGLATGPSVATAAGPRGGWNGGGGWRGRHHRGGGFWPGVAAGALVGGALGSYAYYGGPDYYDYGPDYSADNSYYYDDSAPPVEVGVVGGDASYCAQRYRSYDPASGTYLGYDGERHPCP
jgi:hypothetical protein